MAPTAFVAEGPIAMVASTNVFMAGPELRAMPSVSRCRRKPITLTSVVALTTVVPAVEEMRVTEHDPVPPEVVQLEALRVPGPLTLTNLMTVPSFALTNPEPELTFTWPVRVWGVPTSLVAAGGEIWMLASGRRFVNVKSASLRCSRSAQVLA